MKISYNWLNTKYFDGKLPPVSDVENALMFHAWEVEEIVPKGDDTMIDVKVLPDKSAWALSHRGIAKDLSTVLNIPLAYDPLAHEPILQDGGPALSIKIETPTCDRYTMAYLTGVKVGDSPTWLVESLATIGQRSINNIVDATNYVMFNLGQPLHAFDAKKLRGISIGVRAARDGETIVSLTGESYTLTSRDALIVDGESDTLLGIAGVKGGKAAEVDKETTDLIIESAHFDRVAVRGTSGRLRLRTDASTRYENGVVSHLTSYALRDVVELIQEIGGGTLVGYKDSGKLASTPVQVTLARRHVNSVLGLSLTEEEIRAILDRLGFAYTWSDDSVTVTPPFERTDILIPEDVIEEIGRIYGYDHVVSVVPSPMPLTETNSTFYYTDKIRRALAAAGFSEVYTSSFRAKDAVRLKNAFAADKGYLRSALTSNIDEALQRNAPYADLLQVREIRIFEVGTVFSRVQGELIQNLSIALGVRGASGYKAKLHDAILESGIKVVEEALATTLNWNRKDGIAEAVLTDVLRTLPKPDAYIPIEKKLDTVYRSFSTYPFVSRDIALWADVAVEASTAEAVIKGEAGELLQHCTLFDTFKKDDKVSFAFRLVFQSYDKTLTDEEVGQTMDAVTNALTDQGFVVR